MKIGLGMVTCGVREIPPQLYAHTSPDTLIHIHVDTDRRGPAHARNACLRALCDARCDYIFLFDDDCYPVMAGWERYFVDVHLSRPTLHFFGLPEIFKSQLAGTEGEIAFWRTIVGCFSFQTRHFLRVVGGYDAGYTGYGYEDVGRNQRALRSGLLGDTGTYPSPLRASAYIHSQDVFGEHPTPNLSDAEKAEGIALNHVALLAENASPSIFRPFAC